MTGSSRWLACFVTLLFICGGTISTYVSNYMTTYALTTLHLPATIATTLTLTGGVGQIIGYSLGVWSDRLGRKRALIAWRVALIAIVYPLFQAMTAPGTDVTTIVAANLFFNILFACGIGAGYAFLAEAFPQSVRSSGLAILYAFGVMIFGGTTQFVVAWLIDVTKDPLVPAYYMIAANLTTIVGLWLMEPHAEVLHARETALAPASAPS